MRHLNIKITDPLNGGSVVYSISLQKPIKEIIATLIARFNLPSFTPEGAPISYQLRVKGTSGILNSYRNFKDAGLSKDSELEIFSEQLLITTSSPSSSRTASVKEQEAPSVEALLSQLNTNVLKGILAQNRTTHAVRAFVRFLFIQLSATSFAMVLWNLADSTIDQNECLQSGNNCSGNSALIVAAGIIFIIGVIWSSAAGWEELGKSEVL